MDAKQKRLIRNILSGSILLILVVFTLAYCGVFEGAQSDEAQIRELMERSRLEVNDRDWDDFLDLCDVPDAERQSWIDAIEKTMTTTQGANLVKIDSITPKGMISVPSGATEYELEVSAVGHIDFVKRQLDGVEGTYYFVKKDGRWYIDLNRTSATFPYAPTIKR